MEICHRHKIGHARTGWALPVGAAVPLGTYCLALRRYGLELSDEGVLLAQIDRVVHEQAPYRDFHTGYGPGLFYAQAARYAAFGASTRTVRTGLALVHAARVALAAVLVGSVACARAALVVVFVVVAFFLSVAKGVGTPANVPYPHWYASALGLAASVVLARTRAAGGLVAVGTLWGLAFAFKQNAGLLGIAAAAVTVVLAPERPADRDRGEGGRLVGRTLALALPGGAAFGHQLALEVLRRPPRVVVVLDEPSGPFARAFAAHPELVAALRSRLVEAERIGPYRLLAPKEGE
jgi:hypothetical protein